MTDLHNVLLFFLTAGLFSACSYRFYPPECEKPVEGICFDDAGNLYLSSEKGLQKPALFRVGKREP